MWVFALPWAGWSCEITSGASAAGVGIPTLAWCRWKRSGLSGRGLNGKAAWVRLAGQIWHLCVEHNSKTEGVTPRPPFAQGFYLADLFRKAQGSGLKSCQLAVLPQCRPRSEHEVRQLPPPLEIWKIGKPDFRASRLTGRRLSDFALVYQ